ncbi:ATP-binding protein [Primorskyibacter aestuariivivens]|uniref:ATP-binding protein n=1 Tax=Primorskyibacter aestuariivivens TaxID=1888912 RepID=UPI0023000910|nr:ATP-binding protein [Primorskyibacter aestuariivivens]MDA7428040.1 ATP-binding protein [Primorskyibacter aestuariivivens]
MAGEPIALAEGPVSRRRYNRERRAREEAERLLDQKSRELFEANEALKAQAASLEDQVRTRTAALDRAKRQAEQASEAKTAFLAMMSHEIRTPLNGVMGMADALRDSGLTEAQMELLDVMSSSGQALLSIINDILDLTKIEAQQMEIEAIEFDLVELLDAVTRLYALSAADKGLGFEVQIDLGGRRRIVSDPTRLRQVISNLLSNAIKFTETGGVGLHVRLSDEKPMQLALAVSDSGPGVPEGKQERLFQPFSQVDASVTRRHGGTGLGLSIARKMCRLMGGDLSFTPGVPRGSTFTARVEVAAGQSKPCSPPVALPEAEAVLMARAWRILVAEDNKTNRLVLHHLLKKYSLSITMVENGAEAVAAWRCGSFDLILMDVNMPVMGGLEAVALIRAAEMDRASEQRVPIIALTANAMTHQVEEYLRCGVDGHVAKPVKRERLVQCMAQLLTAGDLGRAQAE